MSIGEITKFISELKLGAREMAIAQRVLKEVLERLAQGSVDIIIGTHRLLQKDIKIDNVGLIIIDEEHRFGVRQKEMLKKFKTNTDFLTLTATPIPRILRGDYQRGFDERV